ncbi:hypothetical protein ACJX0J_034152, partial [Zea mays]
QDVSLEAKQHTNMYPKVMNQGSIMHPLLMIPAQNPGLVPDIMNLNKQKHHTLNS